MIDLARPLPGQPLDERGWGLRVVAATAIVWGSLPTRTGKMVWASVRPGRQESPAITARHPPPRKA
jgi:hypothetical protein